jgi:hypothetical protein
MTDTPVANRFWSYAGIEHPDRLSPYGVAENAAILRRFLYIERRLVQTLAGWLPGAPELEVKYGLARHLWEDAEHAQLLRQRIRQLRVNEHTLDKPPSHRLGLLMDELVYAASTSELVAGVYGLVKTELAKAYRRHLEETQQLVDFPTIRVLRIIVAEEEEQLRWAEEATVHLAQDPIIRAQAAAWKKHLAAFVSAAGGIAGLEQPGEDTMPIGRAATQATFEVDRTGQRDERFETLVPRFRPEDLQEQAPVLHNMARARWVEMQAAEGLAASIYENTDKMPWEYSYDLARHCWDEARHCCLGHLYMQNLGLDITERPVMIGNYQFYRQLSPYERYVRLGIMIEQAAMTKNGKRREYEVCKEQGNALGAQFQDYDWADEVHHAQLARKWTAYMAEEEDTPVEEAIEGIKEKYEAFTRPWVEKGYRF